MAVAAGRSGRRSDPDPWGDDAWGSGPQAPVSPGSPTAPSRVDRPAAARVRDRPAAIGAPADGPARPAVGDRIPVCGAAGRTPGCACPRPGIATPGNGECPRRLLEPAYRASLLTRLSLRTGATPLTRASLLTRLSLRTGATPLTRASLPTPDERGYPVEAEYPAPGETGSGPWPASRGAGRVRCGQAGTPLAPGEQARQAEPLARLGQPLGRRVLDASARSTRRGRGPRRWPWWPRSLCSTKAASTRQAVAAQPAPR